ncbi:H-NS histone family protein [Arenibacterium sp. CAU 1754]
MAIDLKNMSRKELLKLQSDIDKALVAAEERERRDALKAAQDAAAKFGYSLDDLANPGDGRKKRRAKGKRANAAPKYRNPENPEQTWSGMGRKPQWFHDALANKVDIKELEI